MVGSKSSAPVSIVLEATQTELPEQMLPIGGCAQETRKHGAAASSEDEPECTNELCGKLGEHEIPFTKTELGGLSTGLTTNRPPQNILRRGCPRFVCIIRTADPGAAFIQ